MSNTVPPDSHGDVWSDWLLRRRHGDDAAYDQVLQATLGGIADRVVDGARLGSGMTLADIGAGDGLIAFRAIERVGPTLRAVLSDVSQPLLAHVEALAGQRGVRDQCTFIQGSAEKLPGIATASIDAVTSRAVLAYVADKPAALREFHRMLKPGGRLSIGEPIFQDDAFEAGALRKTIESQPAGSLDPFLLLLHRWKAAKFPDTEHAIARSPITNYSERDLVGMVQASGFSEIHMELHIDIRRSLMSTWEVFLGSSPHPWAPSVGAILGEKFTVEERELFERVLRPTIESGQGLNTERVAYLTAVKRST